MISLPSAHSLTSTAIAAQASSTLDPDEVGSCQCVNIRAHGELVHQRNKLSNDAPSLPINEPLNRRQRCLQVRC